MSPVLELDFVVGQCAHCVGGRSWAALLEVVRGFCTRVYFTHKRIHVLVFVPKASFESCRKV